MPNERRPGLLYKTDGTVSEVFPVNGKKFTLEELQGFVGGMIEPVPFSRPDAYCNEEGLLDGLQYNETASKAFSKPGYDAYLVGNVIQTMKPLPKKG